MTVGMAGKSPTHIAAAMGEFLAEDFVRMGSAVMRRCMRIDGRRLYLSGATGFFGKNLLALFAELHRRGARFEVTGLSRDPDRFLAEQRWCAAAQWLDLRRGDVRQAWPASGDYQLLVHAATDTAAAAQSSRLQVFDNIVAGTRHAVALAAATGVQRLLLTGSGAQYGTIPAQFADGISESSPIAWDPSAPDSAYGEGKRVSELLAALHAEQHGFAVVNTRCFAFVGPGLPLDGHFAIGNFIANALARQSIKLHSTGRSLRSYLYGADLAVWLLLLLLEAPNGSTVNVGSSEVVSIVELAQRVRTLLDPMLNVAIGIVEPAEERRHYVPDTTRARGLGLDAWTDLDSAILRTAAWYRHAAN